MWNSLAHVCLIFFKSPFTAKLFSHNDKFKYQFCLAKMELAKEFTGKQWKQYDYLYQFQVFVSPWKFFNSIFFFYIFANLFRMFEIFICAPCVCVCVDTHTQSERNAHTRAGGSSLPFWMLLHTCRRGKVLCNFAWFNDMKESLTCVATVNDNDAFHRMQRQRKNCIPFEKRKK